MAVAAHDRAAELHTFCRSVTNKKAIIDQEPYMSGSEVDISMWLRMRSHDLLSLRSIPGKLGTPTGLLRMIVIESHDNCETHALCLQIPRSRKVYSSQLAMGCGEDTITPTASTDYLCLDDGAYGICVGVYMYLSCVWVS
jgi:hypothetical protein